MSYNKEELFNLPVAEKYELVLDLWESIEDNLLDVTKEEIQFAKKRLELHRLNPSEGIRREELKKKISRKYGFWNYYQTEAEIDLEEAVLWYEAELSGLGNRFYDSFENALDRIAKNPNAFIEISPEIRRIIIKQFPYKIFYTVFGNKIFVIGIMHAKRSKRFVKNRLKKI